MLLAFVLSVLGAYLGPLGPKLVQIAIDEYIVTSDRDGLGSGDEARHSARQGRRGGRGQEESRQHGVVYFGVARQQARRVRTKETGIRQYEDFKCSSSAAFEE